MSTVIGKYPNVAKAIDAVKCMAVMMEWDYKEIECRAVDPVAGSSLCIRSVTEPGGRVFNVVHLYG